MSTSLVQYLEFRKEYDDIISHAINILDAQAGHKVRNERENYGEKIFGKIVCHALSLQKLLPSPDPATDTDIWDISSQYALSRTILESYEALTYIAVDQISEEELECRVLAWKLHAEERRQKMLEMIGSKNPAVKEIERNVRDLREEILDPKLSPYIPKDIRGKIEKNNCPPYLVSRSKRLSAGRINADYFTAALMHLSSHVHTHPFSLHQLFEFKAGTAEAYSLVKVGGQYACGFLCTAVRDMTELFAPRVPKPTTNVHRTLDIWCELLEKGVRLS